MSFTTFQIEAHRTASGRVLPFEMPPDDPLVRLAYRLACKGHTGQFRKDHEIPYIVHVDAVMARAPKDPVSQAVAACHDLVEDARLRFSDLDTEGLPQDVIDGVITLTRGRSIATGQWSESYEAFIQRVATHKGGRWAAVKVADILANLSDSPTPRQIRRYAAALLILVPEQPTSTP